jgi:hypothetical protein
VKISYRKRVQLGTGIVRQLWDSFHHRVENRRQRALRVRRREQDPYPVGQWSRWYKANRRTQRLYGKNLRREWVR